jgi:hypothetical protein
MSTAHHISAVFQHKKVATIAAIHIGLAASSVFAQSIIGLGTAEPRSIGNQTLLAARRAAPKSQGITETATPRVVVFKGDTVISQFVDGGSWLTSITVTNLEAHSTSFDVLFFQDDGTDFNVTIVGGPGCGFGCQPQFVKGLNVTLNPMGTLTFYTTGTNPSLTAGWAALSQTNSDSVGISAVFRQSIPGAQPQEAVVPAVNQFETHFVLNFDDTAYITGLALANPTEDNVAVVANIRNSAGQIIDTQSFSLAPFHHVSFSLPASWASAQGISGTIEFLTSGFGVGALGLRFNGSAFTSINVLENYNWAVN